MRSQYRSLVRRQSIPYTIYRPTVDETSYDDTPTLDEVGTTDLFCYHPSSNPLETISGTIQQGGLGGFALPSTDIHRGDFITHGTEDGEDVFYEVTAMNGMPSDEDVAVYELTLERNDPPPVK